MPRRNVFDPLEPAKTRWFTVQNMHGALLESRLLPAGSDLKRTFVIAMLDHVDAGWLLGEFSSTGAVFFCTRGTERRMISITVRGHKRLRVLTWGGIDPHLANHYAAPARPCTAKSLALAKAVPRNYRSLTSNAHPEYMSV